MKSLELAPVLPPVSAETQEIFRAGAAVVRDGISRQRITPLATLSDIVSIGREDDSARKLLGYVFDAVGTTDLGDVPDLDAFTKLRVSYKGANGRNYSPLPKYIPLGIAPDLTAMQVAYDQDRRARNSDDPRRPGLIIESGYRSPWYQIAVMANEIGRRGVARVSTSVKLPGSSQHADIDNVAIDMTNIGDRNGNIPQPDGTQFGFERTPEFRWLLHHAREHGFWLPYHPDPDSPTSDVRSDGVAVEPWHFQYVNGAASSKMREHNVVPLFEIFTASRSTPHPIS